jgi:hypothetical protein
LDASCAFSRWCPSVFVIAAPIIFVGIRMENGWLSGDRSFTLLRVSLRMFWGYFRRCLKRVRLLLIVGIRWFAIMMIIISPSQIACGVCGHEMTHLRRLISRRGIILLILLSLFWIRCKTWWSIVVNAVSEARILLLRVIVIVIISVWCTALLLKLILTYPPLMMICIISVRGWIERSTIPSCVWRHQIWVPIWSGRTRMSSTAAATRSSSNRMVIAPRRCVIMIMHLSQKNILWVCFDKSIFYLNN